MKLPISRRKWRIALALYYGGLVLMFPAGFAYTTGAEAGWAAAIVSVAAALAGGVWINCLCHCPQCGRLLFGRGLRGLTMTPYPYCPGCGWKTDIEWTD